MRYIRPVVLFVLIASVSTVGVKAPDPSCTPTDVYFGPYPSPSGVQFGPYPTPNGITPASS